jgi:two-component system chemotaxis response regulator CheV
MKAPLLGMVNIRDQVIPVIDLPAVAGCKPETGLNILLITEYARSVQAFAVESVENIMRLDWQQVHTAEKAVNGRYITSIACLDDNKETNNLALVLDVEQILYDIVPANHDLRATDLKTNKFNITPGAVAIVADDSKVARAMLEKGLNAMEIPHLMHVTGQDAGKNTAAFRRSAGGGQAYQREDRPGTHRSRNAGDGRFYAYPQNKNRRTPEEDPGRYPLFAFR